MAEQALWLAVIGQAMIDAIKPNITDISKHNKYRKITAYSQQDQAKAWLNSNNDNFIKVCHLADISAVYVLRRYNYYILTNTMPRLTQINKRGEYNGLV